MRGLRAFRWSPENALRNMLKYIATITSGDGCPKERGAGVNTPER